MTDRGPEPARRDERSGTWRRGVDLPRLLRGVAGVDETLLRRVWHERARHTSLGGVILGTALLAAFSMWVAVNQVLGRVSAWHLFPALLWFLFIINFDRQLVTSMAGGVRRVGPLLARLALAVMFGVVIAEPLVMRIFETAIEQHIREERSGQLDTLRTSLLSCNGEKTATAEDTSASQDCRQYLLSFETTPAAIRRELAGTRTEAAALQKTVDKDTTALNGLREKAARECTGGGGTGFTGRSGNGPRCRQRTAEAEAFARSHPIEENGRKHSELRGRIVVLEQQLSTAVANFEQDRDRKIAERVEEERSHQGPIGFLERLAALHELTGSNPALFASTWAIRLFFIAVDCLPMMAKFFGGTSGYDRLYRVRSESTERIFVDETSTDERRIADRYSADRDDIDNQARMRRAEHELRLQEHQVSLRARRDVAVNDLAAKLLRDPGPESRSGTAPSRSPAGANGTGGLNGRSVL
ncbi:DUF4407 domain-containing protein [Micromonospora cathayae]|uniref:DUF4407 domain-containing protein n=1 Tax=Micromonospora cathayae TaxID=3028804 RepID=A0ABY7ZUC3_9ACTN|nr:DUF4407 domain-containing protein [Micromonospora sp. HUAS 3]WDZ86006.1 DUF4407 domain-containing protein [Micromonospora sp. HUAS 3]